MKNLFLTFLIISLSGCSSFLVTKHGVFSTSELTKDVSWEHEPELVTMQGIAMMTAMSDVCDATKEETDVLDYYFEEPKRLLKATFKDDTYLDIIVHLTKYYKDDVSYHNCKDFHDSVAEMIKRKEKRT